MKYLLFVLTTILLSGALSLVYAQEERKARSPQMQMREEIDIKSLKKDLQRNQLLIRELSKQREKRMRSMSKGMTMGYMGEMKDLKICPMCKKRMQQGDADIINNLLMLKDKIELSNKQISKLKELRLDHARNTVEIEGYLKIAQMELHDQLDNLDNDDIDLGIVESKIHEIAEFQADIRIAKIILNIEARKVLTLEQRRKIKTLGSKGMMMPGSPMMQMKGSMEDMTHDREHGREHDRDDN